MPLAKRVFSVFAMVRLQLVLFVLVVSNLPSMLCADIVQYTFTGEIPVGAIDTHTEIDIGETWVAFFFVDTTIIDTSIDPEFGSYLDAVISGRLTFSGGYTSTFDQDAYNVAIGNDSSGFDYVSIQDTVELFNITAITDDTSTLMSDSLPVPGTSFFASPSVISRGPQLTFVDSNGEIDYGADLANNVSFLARAVPEPSHFLANLLVTLAATVRRRKRDWSQKSR